MNKTHRAVENQYLKIRARGTYKEWTYDANSRMSLKQSRNYARKRTLLGKREKRSEKKGGKELNPMAMSKKRKI